MEIVPYNINIMDQKGEIIASGDKGRIGSIHQGAVKVIEGRGMHNVYEDTETERRGVNLPILYNMQILGVIGISGEVDEVLRIARIVATVAQLMVENDIINDMVTLKETRLNNFLYEWAQRKAEEYDEAFLKQAQYFGIDVRKSRTAVLFVFKRVRFSVIEQIKKILRDGDYIIRQSMDRVVILFEEMQFWKKIDDIMSISSDLAKCYVGESSEIALESVQSVEKVMKTAKILPDDQKIISYDGLRLECLLSETAEDKIIHNVMEIMKEQDVNNALQNTILIYADTNEDQKKTCSRLFIHRNTLNYRLDRIRELTGLNPRNGRNLILLYIAALRLRGGGNNRQREYGPQKSDNMQLFCGLCAFALKSGESMCFLTLLIMCKKDKICLISLQRRTKK